MAAETIKLNVDRLLGPDNASRQSRWGWRRIVWFATLAVAAGLMLAFVAPTWLSRRWFLDSLASQLLVTDDQEQAAVCVAGLMDAENEGTFGLLGGLENPNTPISSMVFHWIDSQWIQPASSADDLERIALITANLRERSNQWRAQNAELGSVLTGRILARIEDPELIANADQRTIDAIRVDCMAVLEQVDRVTPMLLSTPSIAESRNSMQADSQFTRSSIPTSLNSPPPPLNPMRSSGSSGRLSDSSLSSETTSSETTSSEEAGDGLIENSAVGSTEADSGNEAEEMAPVLFGPPSIHADPARPPQTGRRRGANSSSFPSNTNATEPTVNDANTTKTTMTDSNSSDNTSSDKGVATFSFVASSPSIQSSSASRPAATTRTWPIPAQNNNNNNNNAESALDRSTSPEPVSAKAPMESWTTTEVVKALAKPDAQLTKAASIELLRRGMTAEEVELAMELATGDSEQRRVLLQSLPQRRSIDPRPWLLWMADDSDRGVRECAVAMLGSISDPSLEVHLRRILAKEADLEIADKIRSILVAMRLSTARQ